MPEIDDPRGSMSGLQVIHVDISGLDRFAETVEAEASANFRPQATNLMKVYEVGSHFGLGHSSADVIAARHKHTQCLEAAATQLADYANATKILVDAARAVAARYRASDAFTAANLAEVNEALEAARQRASAALRNTEGQPPAPRDHVEGAE